MSEVRPVLPTDLLALVSYDGHSYRNEAWPRERLGQPETSRPLNTLMDQFFAFARGRGAWISVRRQRLQGLVGARQRGGRPAWEIDCLVDAAPDRDVVTGLLEHAIAETGRSGAEKLFLRLAAGSDLVPVVVNAGFTPYREELLYGGLGGRSDGAGTGLRPVSPADSYLLYRLYNASTPEAVRRSEAATYGEWQASLERRWLKNPVQLVSEREGQIDAAVRGSRLSQGISLDLQVDDAGRNEVSSLLDAAVGALAGEGLPLYVLLGSTDVGMAGRLADYGLTPRGEYISFMRRTTRLQSLPKLTPAIAKSAVGA